MKRIFLEYRSHFDAAHFLRGYDGACANLHGHRWEVLIKISGTFLDENGILVDFKVLKELMKRTLPDHQSLNDISAFTDVNPTAENLASFLFNRLRTQIVELRKDAQLQLESVRVYESPEACALVERGADE